MAFKWRKWNNILHRDTGYLIVGMTVIYSLSGIALNHRQDWNPNYEISHQEVLWQGGVPAGDVARDDVLGFLETMGEGDAYKQHYIPEPGQVKIFLHGGSITLDRATGAGYLERIRRRPVFFEVNFLHYNPGRLWTWFSDLFCGVLIFVAITGLFVLKGRKGITGRGAWLTAIGFVLPLGFLIAYL
ncbi:MAG: hypothetical protein GY838_15120 [bacterium]|nr:hypothetical protein [bacterium]